MLVQRLALGLRIGAFGLRRLNLGVQHLIEIAGSNTLVPEPSGCGYCCSSRSPNFCPIQMLDVGAGGCRGVGGS